METQQKHIKDFEESDSTKKVDISDEDKINIQK